MRDIRFRAWDKGKNEMLSWPELMRDKMLVYSFFGNESWMTNPPKPMWERMQFTGLLDKNGKEIFEGDLLRWAGDDEQNFTAFEVFFHDGDSNASYDIGYSISRTHHQGNVAGGYIPPLKPKTAKQMIVIGNIYEHKHLLK